MYECGASNQVTTASSRRCPLSTSSTSANRATRGVSELGNLGASGAAYRFRKVDANLIIRQAIRLRQGQIDVTVAQLESHYLAGGRVSAVVGAVLAAKASGVTLEWGTATALDLGPRPWTGVDAKALVGGAFWTTAEPGGTVWHA